MFSRKIIYLYKFGVFCLRLRVCAGLARSGSRCLLTLANTVFVYRLFWGRNSCSI